MPNMRAGALDGLAAAGGMKDRVQSYQNMANILTESVSKAKERYRHLAPGLEQSLKSSPQRVTAPATFTAGKAIGSSQRSVPAMTKADMAGVETDQRIKKQR